MKLRQQQLAMFTLCSALLAACDPSTPKGGVADAGTTPTTSTKPGTTTPGSGLDSDSGTPDATGTDGAGGTSGASGASGSSVTDEDVPPVTTATSSGVGITSSAGEPLPDAGVAPDGTVPSTKGIVKLRLKVK